MNSLNGQLFHRPPVDLAAFEVGFCNLRYGGIDPETRDDAGLRATVRALTPHELDVLAVQEVDGGGNPNDVWRIYRRYANALGMEPVLGPSVALRGRTGNHTGVLVRTRPDGLRILDQWPPPGVAAPRVPWCQVELQVPGLPYSLHVYSLHASARSQTDQLRAVEVLTNQITERQERAFVLGDFNGYPREPRVTPAELAQIGDHLKLTRCRVGPEGELTPIYDVYDTLVRARLVDVAAHVAACLGAPELLRPTGKGGARVDRCHASVEVAATATGYRQVTTGSDHDAGVLTFDLRPLTIQPHQGDEEHGACRDA
jgi:endonuclease/exonuclease/phosphatase family metal-dependent hydrolase